MKPEKKAAFGLVELILIVAFLGIFAAIAVPRLNFAIISKQKADTFARKIVTDLRLTRRLAISDAANNTKGFNLNMLGSEPYNSYEIENDDTNIIVNTHTIDSDVTVTTPTGQNFKFTPLGNLEPASGTGLIVSAEGKSFTITINPATGAVKCVEN
jgi:Tfp pilus assembly protein FimT